MRAWVQVLILLICEMRQPRAKYHIVNCKITKLGVNKLIVYNFLQVFGNAKTHKDIYGFRTLSAELSETHTVYVSLEILVFLNSCKLLDIDLINTKLWDLAVYCVVFLSM